MGKRIELRSVLSGTIAKTHDEGYNAGNPRKPSSGRQQIERMLERTVEVDGQPVPVWYPIRVEGPWTAGSTVFEPPALLRTRPVWGPLQDALCERLRKPHDAALAAAHRAAEDRVKHAAVEAAAEKAAPMPDTRTAADVKAEPMPDTRTAADVKAEPAAKETAKERKAARS